MKESGTHSDKAGGERGGYRKKPGTTHKDTIKSDTKKHSFSPKALSEAAKNNPRPPKSTSDRPTRATKKWNPQTDSQRSDPHATRPPRPENRPKSARPATEGRKPFRDRPDGERPFKFEKWPQKERSNWKKDSGNRPPKPEQPGGDPPTFPKREKPYDRRRQQDDRRREPRSEQYDRQPGDRPFDRTNRRPPQEQPGKANTERAPWKRKDKHQDQPDNAERPSTRSWEQKSSRPFDKGRPKQRLRAGRHGDDRRPRRNDIEREQFEDKVYVELPTEQPTRRFQRNEEDEREIAGPMTLNKYLAHSGHSSRRDAAGLVKQGKVRVNGELVLDPGYRVQPGDQVSLLGKKMTPQRNRVYLLLNKPKGYITTTEDPLDRRTVMDLVATATEERLYPVGRLDRNTTGLLLLTNDGALANKLAHPTYNIKKVYHVVLNKNLTTAHYDQIRKGVTLEDGLAQVDEIAYLESRNELGVEIHSGKNRIVRRIFESLGYEVEKLDRVMYAGLTKKNLPRGKWRLLDEKEVIMLKHFKS